MPTCAWCGAVLGSNHGYDRYGNSICASYENPPARAYNSCKARKSRNALKKPSTSQPERPEGHSTLIEALQVLISQNDEIIALHKQALSQPRQLVKEETIKTIQTTREFTTPDFGEDDLGIEIKKDTSTTSSKNFLDQLKAMQSGEGVWGKGKEQ